MGKLSAMPDVSISIISFRCCFSLSVQSQFRRVCVCQLAIQIQPLQVASRLYRLEHQHQGLSAQVRARQNDLNFTVGIPALSPSVWPGGRGLFAAGGHRD